MAHKLTVAYGIVLSLFVVGCTRPADEAADEIMLPGPEGKADALSSRKIAWSDDSLVELGAVGFDDYADTLTAIDDGTTVTITGGRYHIDGGSTAFHGKNGFLFEIHPGSIETSVLSRLAMRVEYRAFGSDDPYRALEMPVMATLGGTPFEWSFLQGVANDLDQRHVLVVPQTPGYYVKDGTDAFDYATDLPLDARLEWRISVLPYEDPFHIAGSFDYVLHETPCCGLIPM